MAQQIHKNHIKRRTRRAEAPKVETTVYPEDSERTDSGFTVSGYKGTFETLSETVIAGGVSTIRRHMDLPRLYRIEGGYCLFVMVDSNGAKTEVIGSPGKEILVPEGFAHYIKGHVDLDTNLYVVQEKDFLDEFLEEANSTQVAPFAEAIHNHTPNIPLPRKKRPRKSKAAEQNRKFSASKGHVSAEDAAQTGLSSLMKQVTDPTFKVDNQRPTVLSGRDLGR